MAEHKHTRGEWYARDAQIIRITEKTPLIRIASVNKRFPNYEANARLIAQAPALLEALEAAEEILSDFADDDGSVWPVRKQILEAIAAATAPSDQKIDVTPLRDFDRK